MSGPSFRDYHELLDVHGAELLAMTDPMAERVRKIGGETISGDGLDDGAALAADLKEVISKQAEHTQLVDKSAVLVAQPNPVSVTVGDNSDIRVEQRHIAQTIVDVGRDWLRPRHLGEDGVTFVMPAGTGSSEKGARYSLSLVASRTR